VREARDKAVEEKVAAEPSSPGSASRKKTSSFMKRSATRPSKEDMGKDAEAGEAKASSKEKVPSYFTQIVGIQRDSLWLLGLGLLFAAVTGGAPLFGFRQLVGFFGDLFQLSGEVIAEDVKDRAVYIGAVIGITIVAQTIDSTCFGIAANRLTAQMRNHAFTAFMRQDIGFFDSGSNSAGELVSFLSEKVTMVESVTGGTLQAVVRVMTAVVVLLVLVFRDGPWQLGLYLFVAFPLFMGFIGAVMNVVAGDEMKKAKGEENNSKAAQAEKSAGKLLNEVVLAIRTITSFNAEERLLQQYAVGVERARKLDHSAALIGCIAISVMMPAFVSMFGLMYWYMGYLINERICTFEEGMIAMMLMMGLMMPVMGAIGGVKDIPTANKAAKRFFESTSRVSLVDPTSTDGEKPAGVVGEVEVRDIVFAYPSAPDHRVCKGYSLAIPAGQTVALCGPSGSGKSTIISLIERFYDPQEGVVMLDGKDIRTLNVRWLRMQLGLVSQEPVLFSGSVAENIKYGKLGATQEEIEEACKMANAHTFVCEVLANGYETDVGQGGSKLSGGQKQRVAIARAIIKKPSVLLLDEATSALDNESERIVQAALDEIMTKQKRTTIVIAHRLSTIRNADKIAVINEGKVVEEGSHDELLQNTTKNGLYANLVLAQSGD